jgi:O-antigen ligase
MGSPISSNPFRMPLSLTRANLQRALLLAAVAGACTASGWALVQHSKFALIPVAVLAGLAGLAVFAEIGLKALWVWPPLGVLAYPVSDHLGSKYIAFDRIWVGGMVVLLLTLPRVRRHMPASRRMMITLVLLTAVIGVRSELTHYGSLYPVRIWFDSLLVPLILFALVRRAVGLDGRLAERIAFSLIVAGLLLALIGIAEHLLGFQLATDSGSLPRIDPSIGTVRISGPYGAPETYGLTLVICLAATLYWLLGWPRTGALRFAAVGVAGLEILAIFLTFFRVGWISALLVVLAAVGLRPHRYGRAIATLVVAALVAVPLFVELERVPAVSTRVQNTDNIYTRLAIYEQAWHIFESAPLFGVGAQRYTDVATTLPVVFVHGAGSVPYPHSSFFEAMTEDGVVGLIALLAAVGGVWGLVRALNRTAHLRPDAVLAAVLTGAALSYLIYSLTLEMLPFSPSNEMFAILLGMAAGRLDFLGRVRARQGDPKLMAG